VFVLLIKVNNYNVIFAGAGFEETMHLTHTRLLQIRKKGINKKEVIVFTYSDKE